MLNNIFELNTQVLRLVYLITQFWIITFLLTSSYLHAMIIHIKMINPQFCTVEPRYNEVLGTMKITLLYQVSHYIRVKKQRNIKSWDQQNYLVIRGFCYIRPLYNEVPLYTFMMLFPLPSLPHCRDASKPSSVPNSPRPGSQTSSNTASPSPANPAPRQQKPSGAAAKKSKAKKKKGGKW